jgi:hypothetical protein
MEHLIIWLEIKPFCFSFDECNPKQIFVGDDRSLSVVGSGTIHVGNVHFNDVNYVFQVFPATFYQCIRSFI